VSADCESIEGCYENARFRCYSCYLYFCGKHSAMRDYNSYRVQGGWKVRRHRICDGCAEEAAIAARTEAGDSGKDAEDEA